MLTNGDRVHYGWIEWDKENKVWLKKHSHATYRFHSGDRSIILEDNRGNLIKIQNSQILA